MSDQQNDPPRRHRRVPASIPVRISTIEPDLDPWTGRPFFRASQERCANLSRGGAFVRTTELLDPGKRVLLEMQLPNGSQVETVGRVAWTRRTLSSGSEPDSGVGIEFLGGATDELLALEAYLEQASGASDDRNH